MIIKKINKYRGTHLTILLNAIIIKRFVGGKKPLSEAAKAVGKACEPHIGAASNANTPSLTESSTSKQANNAAAQLQTNSPVLPTTEIIKPQTEKIMPSSTPVSQTPPKTLPPKIKEYEFTSNNSGVQYAFQKSDSSTKKEAINKDHAFVTKDPSKDLFPANVNATSHNAWTSFKNSSNSQGIKDDFDPAEEALKLAFNLGANSNSNTSDTSTTTTSSSQTSSNTPQLQDIQDAVKDINDGNESINMMTSNYSNLTSPSFKEDSASIAEKEALIEQAINLGLLTRRDAPDNPSAGSEHLTVKGNTVYKDLQKKEEVLLSKKPIDLSKTPFQTGTLTIDQNKTIVPRSDQTHAVVTTQNSKIYIWGYLTSHKGEGTFKIADKQMDGAKNLDGTDKPQYYKPFAQPVEVSPDKFTQNFEGNIYLQNPNIIKELSLISAPASQYEPIPYKEIGLTKEELEAMIAKQVIEEGEKALDEAKKPSNFLEDDKKKKTAKKEDLAKKNQEKQKKESQEKKAKAKADAESKLKSSTDDQ